MPLLAALATVAGLTLFSPPVAVAQSESIWSTTLTVGEQSAGGTTFYGCFAAHPCSTNLTEDSFTHRGTSYSVAAITLASAALGIVFDSPPSRDWTLRVGTQEFALADASFNGNQASWTDTGLSWSSGDTVSLGLTVPSTTPTLDWSATLTVGEQSAGGTTFYGCFAAHPCSANLTEDSFTHVDTSYSVAAITLASAALGIVFDSPPRRDWTLRVGTQEFAMADASFNGNQASWTDTGLSWSSGDTVSLGLTSPGIKSQPGPGGTTDPPGGTADPDATTETPRNPEPLQLALWTDQSGYRAGETVGLYRTVDPHDDDRDYRTFVYLEQAGGGQRRYLAPLSASGTLHEDAVDHRGIPAAAAAPRSLSAADRELIWEGEAPAPGLWQFVLELRPGEPEEQSGETEEPYGTRRAWAKFTVAARSLLLNRRGFDREIRADTTLRSDTIYYLGHQLFVHDGATLTIEPGTTLRAWGRNTAIIVEPGGRIVAEGTRETPVVLGCSSPVGRRRPGCWAGLRILGQAPVTRLEGVAPGVLPAERPVYGGAEAEDSSGVLRYVRVEFAGAAGDEPEAAGPAIGLYGAGSGTVLDHVQAHASLGDGFAFSGGTAVCGHCVASSSGNTGLSWQRGWRGGASHLYVQQGSGGLHGLTGGNDEQGHDLEPRSLPALSNVTLVHTQPYGKRERRAVALRLSTGSGVLVSDLLTSRFLAGAIDARGRSALLFGEGVSAVRGALLYRSDPRPLRGGIQNAVEFIRKDPKLRDVRDFANPDPRPKADSPALADEGDGYIGAFGRTENWLEEWTVFGPESVYDLRERVEEDD